MRGQSTDIFHIFKESVVSIYYLVHSLKSFDITNPYYSETRLTVISSIKEFYPFTGKGR